MTDTNSPDSTLIDLPEEEQHFAFKRMIEALLFASEEPVAVLALAERLPAGVDCMAVITDLQKDYEGRGIELVVFGGKAFFRTASDLAFLLRREVDETRKLSRAGVETLAIIAYHQPVTRAEIEDIRGVSISKGTLDVLMEAGWVAPKGRKRTPGRPVTYGTTNEFLIHFGIESIKDLPGMAELKAAGLLDTVEDALEELRHQTDPDANDPQIDLEEAINQSEYEAGKAQIRQEPSD